MHLTFAGTINQAKFEMKSSILGYKLIFINSTSYSTSNDFKDTQGLSHNAGILSDKLNTGELHTRFFEFFFDEVVHVLRFITEFFQL